MESREVEPQSEAERASELEDVDNIQQTGPECSSIGDELSQFESGGSESTHQQPPSNVKQTNKSLRKWFKLFVALCIQDSDESIEAVLNNANLIMPSGFRRSSKLLFGYLEHTIECLFNRFDKLDMIKNIICVIYKDPIWTIQSQMMMNAAFERLCTQELKKLLSNQEWSKIVIFGTLLCHLTVTYHGQSVLFIEEFNVFIEEIIKSALSGSHDGCIAFKLILNQVTKHETVFADIDRGYSKILDTLTGDEDYGSKVQKVEQYLSRAFDKNWKDRVQFELESKNSQKCKSFDEYLNSNSKGSNDCCEFFVDATNNELEYFARKFIDFTIGHPEQVKILGTVASKYEAIKLRVRKFVREVANSLRSEFKDMKGNEKVDPVKLLNLAKLLGELYASENQICPSGLMESYLKFLKKNSDFMTLTAALKLCGYDLKSKEPKHFENIMKSFIFSEIIEVEIKKMSESFTDKSSFHQLRLFQPAKSAKKFVNLETVLNGVLKGQEVAFSYGINQMLYINTKGLISMLIGALPKPDANVIEAAKFLKSLFDFTFKIENFTERLEANLRTMLSDLSAADNLQDMKTLGMLIAELCFLCVINDDVQELWLEEVKTFESDDIFEVMEVYVDVAKAMLVNVQIYDFELLQKVHKYLQVINTSLESVDTAIAIRIKSKIGRILPNVVLKVVDDKTSELIFGILVGKRIAGLPEDMTESSLYAIDVQDFATIFYVNATSNHHFTSNFGKSIQALKSGPLGLKFIQSLRDTLSSNLFPQIYSPEFCESDEAPGVFTLIGYLFKEDALSESRILSLLKIIQEFKNIGTCREVLIKFTEAVHLTVNKRARRHASRLGQDIRDCIEKVLMKLKLLDVECVERKSSQNIQSSQVAEKSSSDLSSFIMHASPSLSTDTQIMFYVNQLNESNVQQIKDIISMFLALNFSPIRLARILVQKAISDESCTDQAVDLLKDLMDKKNFKEITGAMGRELIYLCKKEDDQDEHKVMNLANVILDFDPYLKESFWFKLLLKLIDHATSSLTAFKVLVLLMSEKIELISKSNLPKKLIKGIAELLRSNLGAELDFGLKYKMNIVIEEGDKRKRERKKKSFSDNTLIMESREVEPQSEAESASELEDVDNIQQTGPECSSIGDELSQFESGRSESKLQPFLIINCHSLKFDDNNVPADQIKSSKHDKRLLAPKTPPLNEAKVLNEVEKSQKCKDFDEHLKSISTGINASCDFFSDATNNELEYFAIKFIEFAIAHPEQVKMLGSIASKYQSAMLRVRRFIKDIISSLKSEFEVMKDASKVDSLKTLNLGKFLAELFVSEKQIIPNNVMAEFLDFLKSSGDSITLAATLKVCGYFYKDRNQTHFEDLMESFIFREVVEDEITKGTESSSGDYYGLYEARLFKPASSAAKIGSLESVLSRIFQNREVSFGFKLIELLHINTRRMQHMLINSLPKQDANVIEAAKLLKSLNDFSYKIAKFMTRLKINLKLKIFDLSTDNLKDVKTLGMLTAELNNLHVLNDDSRKLWLEAVKQFESDDVFEAMEVYVDVVKSMLVNVQIYEFEEQQDIHQYLQDINSSLESYNTEAACRIKSKIAQILQNIVLKKVDITTSELLFKIRLGQKIDGLPKEMPETSPNELDLQDFVKIFYVSAISNYLFTANFVNSIKFIKSGPKGDKFIQLLRETLSSNLFPNIFASDFCESDEAAGTFELIVHLFKKDVLSESEIKSFLEIIHDLESYGNCREILRAGLEEVESIVEQRARVSSSMVYQDIQDSIERIQKKLNILDVKQSTDALPKEGSSHEIDTVNANTALSDPSPSAVDHKEADLTANSILASQRSQKSITTAITALNAAQSRSNDIKSTSGTAKADQRISEDSTKPKPGALAQDDDFSWLEVNFLLKPGGSYQEQSKPSNVSKDQQNLSQLIRKYILKPENKRLAGESVEHRGPSPIQSANSDLFDSYCQILPIFTASPSQFIKCAVELYSWQVFNSSLMLPINELTELLSKDFQSHNEQLLTDVCTELKDECNNFCAARGIKRKKRKAQLSQQVSAFRAVFPFLENHQILDILHCMLILISDGKGAALCLFLDVVEGLEGIFRDENEERDMFVACCIDALEYAVRNVDEDLEIIKRATKCLDFFKGIKIKPEIPSQLPKKKKRRKVCQTSSQQQSCESSEKSVVGSSQVAEKSSGQSSQVTETSSGLIKESQSTASSVIVDPPQYLKMDDQFVFYIEQLNKSNVQQIKKIILNFLARSLSEQRVIEILLHKAIYDESCTNLAVDLMNDLIAIKNSETVIYGIENELISLCKETDKKEDKMAKLANVMLKFNLYSQESFWQELWQTLFVIASTNSSALIPLVLLMSEKIELFDKIKSHKKLMKRIATLLRNKITTDVDQGLIYKMNVLITAIEKGLEAGKKPKKQKKVLSVPQSKVNKQAPSSSASAVGSNFTRIEEKIIKSITDRQVNASSSAGNHNNPTSLPNRLVLQSLKEQAAFTKIQRSSTLNYIQPHPDHLVRPLNFPPDSFLFDDSVPNPQKFKRIIKTLCEDCKGLELNKDNSIIIREFIAVAIIKVNILKTNPSHEEVNKCAEIFFKIYTRLDQTKFMQWVLMKFLKAWNLYDQNNVRATKEAAGNMTKLYDRYSKSVLRIIKSYKITSIPRAVGANYDDGDSSCCSITSKTESPVLDKDQIPVSSASSLESLGTKPKSEPKSLRTLMLKFDDLVLKTEKSSSSALNSKSDDVKLNANDVSSRKDDLTSKSGDLTSKSGNLTSKSGDLTSNSSDLTSNSGDLTSKSGNLTSKFGDLTSNSSDLTSNSGDLTSKSGDLTSNSGDLTSKPGDLTSKSGNLTSKSGDLTSKSGNLTSNSSDLTSNSGDLTSKSGNLTSKSGDLTSNFSNITIKSLSIRFFGIFQTNLQNLLFNKLVDTTVDVDRDPFFDYFLFKKKRTYEIVCDLHFHDLTSTNFLFHCITKMFEHPLIIERSLDVVVRLMILTKTFISIRQQQNAFIFVLQVLETFWLRLPLNIEFRFPVSVDKWTVLKNFIHKALLCRSNAVEFRALIESLWTELTEKPERFADVVRVFEDFLEVLGDSFAVLIVDFMENRRMSLDKFPTNNISKVMSLKFKTSILFAFELFEMAVLNCEMLSRWLSDNVYGKLMQEHKDEILVEFGQKELKVDGNLEDNLMIYSRKLNNLG